MLIKEKNNLNVKSSSITPKSIFINRRKFIQSAIASGLFPGLLPSYANGEEMNDKKLRGVIKSPYSTPQETTPYEIIKSYNNFYEFHTSKDMPAILAKNFKTKPWTIRVDGEVNKPGIYDIDDIIKSHQLEERTYRFRCVEAWSMVVPWIGIQLSHLIKQFEPTSRAKFVSFQTLYDPKQMPGQLKSVLKWPYVEGLRIDEAMHPLSLLAIGLYGEILPNQNGAPARLVIPWKYGFKSIKSIVSIKFVEQMPPTSWSRMAPNEYGFYANVNPEVSHPRWSQAKERVLGSSYFSPKVNTIKFNGYENEVASLYDGMDLNKFF